MNSEHAPDEVPGRSGPDSIVDRAELARRLTEQRERAGLSVRDVSRAAGLPLGTVGGYLSGRHLPQLATMDQFARMLAALAIPEDERPAWLEVVSRLRRAPGPRPAATTPPYRGLAAYEQGDAALYFGREHVVTTLVARVLADPTTPVMVVGPSGSGKSSLLRAGLAAQLDAQGVRVVVTRPGPDPSGALESAVAELAAAPPGRRVLVVDQLEEALLHDASLTDGTPSDVRGLVDRLAALHTTGTTVVLGLRADVFELALSHEALARWLTSNAVALGALDVDDLRRVVVEPARHVGIDVDDALVDVLVSDATSSSSHAVGERTNEVIDVGVLPLVSHALYATWAASTGRRLTLAGYRAVGGVFGAAAQSAEAVVADLEPELLAAARRLLLALVHMHEHHLSAQSVALSSLGPQETTIAAALVDARLLTADRDELRLAHEALLSAWPRLSAWIDEDREALYLHGALTEATRHWLAADRDPDLLFRGARLEATILRTAEGRRAVLPDEEAFLDASRAAQDRETTARRRSVRRLRVLAAGLTVLALSTLALSGEAIARTRTVAHERDLAVSRQLAVTSATLTGTDAALAAQVGAAASATADTVEARSALLSTSGIFVPARLADVGTLVNDVTVDPSGTLLAVATGTSAVELWSIADAPRRTARIMTDDSATYTVAFSPDGRTLLAGGDSGALHAWSVADPGAPAPLPVAGEPAEGTLYDAVVSVDGTLVAAAASDGSVHVWRRAVDRVTALSVLPPQEAGAAQAVALDPAARTLAVTGDTGTVTLWDVTDATAPERLGASVALDGPGASLAWSPDGSTLAAGTTGGLVRLLDVTDPSSPHLTQDLTGPASWVNDLTFAPDGARLAAASSDKRVWVWDPSTGAVAGRVPTPTVLTTVDWGPDGAALFAAGSDGILREWAYPGPVASGFSSIPGAGAFGTAADGSPVLVTATTDGLAVWDARRPDRLRRVGHVPAPEGARLDGAVAVSPSAHLAVAGDTAGTVHAFDVSDPSHPALVTSVHAHTDWINGIAFDRTGQRLAISSDDRSLTLWDLTGPFPPSPTARVDGFDGEVYALAFSPDGHTLAAAVLSGSVRLLDVTDLRAPTLVGPAITGPTGYVYSVAYSPAAPLVAATGNDGSMWLWSVADPTAPVAVHAPLHWGEGYGTNTSFSPDGRLVATGMTDGTVRVWDVSDPAHPRRWASLSGIDGTVYGVEFTADGSYVSGAGADRTVRVWDLTVEGATARACEIAGRGLAMTDDEWARTTSDVARPTTC